MIPLLGVTFVHVAIDSVAESRFVWSLAEPSFTLWFLYGVIFWRLILPYIASVRWPILLGISLSLLIGFDSSFGDDFALSRVVGYFPFFLIGWWLRSDNARRFRDRTWQRESLAIVILGFWIVGVTVLWKLGVIDRRLFGMTDSYGTVGDLIARFLLIGTSVCVVLAVLYTFSRNRVRFVTYIGQGGFYIYLLHGLVIRGLKYFGLIPAEPDPSVGGYVLLLIFGVVLSGFLGSRLVRKLARPLVQPRLEWLFKS